MKKLALIALIAAVAFTGSGCLWAVPMDDDAGVAHRRHDDRGRREHRPSAPPRPRGP